MWGVDSPHHYSKDVIVIIFYDFEVFKYDWLAVFVDMTKKKKYVIINSKEELKALYEANMKDIIYIPLWFYLYC